MTLMLPQEVVPADDAIEETEVSGLGSLSDSAETDEPDGDRDEKKSVDGDGGNGAGGDRLAVFACAAASAALMWRHLRRRQDRLTVVPSVYAIPTPRNDSIVSLMPNTSASLRPSLLIGQFASAASARGYVRRPPPASDGGRRWREILVTPHDRELLAMDWEYPASAPGAETDDAAERRAVTRPVLLLLHGLNNDSSFGYVRGAARAATDAGIASCALNYRGCGGVDMVTPRAFNAGFTGDLRHAVDAVTGRMRDSGRAGAPPVRLFLCGFSLGANLVVKYLGEEGRDGSLHPRVAGGVSVANPFRLSAHLSLSSGALLGLGVKRSLFSNRSGGIGLAAARSPSFKKSMRKAMMSYTITGLDDALAPHMIRVEDWYPFTPHNRGYRNGADYYAESSCIRLVSHVSVPMLVLAAADDFISDRGFMAAMPALVRNPNVIVVRTSTGGHLGWHAAPGINPFGSMWTSGGAEWMDGAVVDFVLAALATEKNQEPDKEGGEVAPNPPDRPSGKGLPPDKDVDLVMPIRSKL